MRVFSQTSKLSTGLLVIIYMLISVSVAQGSIDPPDSNIDGVDEMPGHFGEREIMELINGHMKLLGQRITELSQ